MNTQTTVRPQQNLSINTQPNHEPRFYHNTQSPHKENNNQTPTQDIPESSNTRNQSQPSPTIPKSFLYSETDIHEGISACSSSLIGKFITDKPIHVNSIQNGLENIWGAPQGLKIQELGGKIMQFYMKNKADQERILYGNPWIFRNSWLVVKPWDRGTDLNTVDFDHVPIWIQLWGLPQHCKTKKMGENIGALLGKVEESEFYEYPGKKVIIKIKVAINVHNPITSGIHVGNLTDGTSWIDFRYEKLPQVCFNCGLLGHGDKLCRNQALNVDTLAPIGPWIRSTQYGRRKMEEKDKKYYSNPSHSKDFGHYSPPVPSDLLEKLAALKVHSPTQSSSSHNTTNDGSSSTQKSGNGSRTDIQAQQADINKKPHRLSHIDNMETSPEPISQLQGIQTKRQKTDDYLRADSAMQAGPEP
jgi:hypothetical protein